MFFFSLLNHTGTSKVHFYFPFNWFIFLEPFYGEHKENGDNREKITLEFLMSLLGFDQHSLLLFLLGGRRMSLLFQKPSANDKVSAVQYHSGVIVKTVFFVGFFLFI